jgi:hypothetical protein
VLGRELASVEGALGRWQHLERSVLTALADGHRTVIQEYESMKSSATAALGRDLLKSILPETTLEFLVDPHTLEMSWDALYAADSTGPDAGPRLEEPMAALRLLHFVALLSEQPRPTGADALTALRALPALPRVFYDARKFAQSFNSSQPDAQPLPPKASSRTPQLRELARDLVATERTLQLITSTAGLGGPTATSSPATEQGGWHRRDFTIRSGPTLNEGRSFRAQSANEDED